MSATLRQEYQATIEKIPKQKPTIVCCGEMARRNIAFIGHLCGAPSAGIRSVVSQAYTQHPPQKTLVCTNSNTNTETTLTSLAASMLIDHTITGAVIALPGECGHWILYPSPPAMALASGMLILLLHSQGAVMRQFANMTLISVLFIDEAHTSHREGLSGSKFRVEF